jgi:hypothetical protein
MRAEETKIKNKKKKTARKKQPNRYQKYNKKKALLHSHDEGECSGKAINHSYHFNSPKSKQNQPYTCTVHCILMIQGNSCPSGGGGGGGG